MCWMAITSHPSSGRQTPLKGAAVMMCSAGVSALIPLFSGPAMTAIASRISRRSISRPQPALSPPAFRRLRRGHRRDRADRVHLADQQRGCSGRRCRCVNGHATFSSKVQPSFSTASLLRISQQTNSFWSEPFGQRALEAKNIMVRENLLQALVSRWGSVPATAAGDGPNTVFTYQPIDSTVSGDSTVRAVGVAQEAGNSIVVKNMQGTLTRENQALEIAGLIVDTDGSSRGVWSDGTTTVAASRAGLQRRV